MKAYEKGFVAVIAELAVFGLLGCGGDDETVRASGAESDTDLPDLPDEDEGEAEGPADDDDDDGNDGESSSGDPSESSGEMEACEGDAFSYEISPTTPSVMLVLDKSRSMSNLWDHDLDASTPEISRWHSLHNVVEHLVTDFGEHVDFGAQLFPSTDAWLDEPVNDWSCRVLTEPEVAVGPGTGDQILAAIPAGEDFSISGGTPAAAGLRSAIDHLHATAPEGPRAVVFVTDGAANCNAEQLPADTLFVYDEDVPEVIRGAFEDHNIPVYVVGINILDEIGEKPTVNAHEAITDAASAGGALATGEEPYYNAFNEPELTTALDEVLGGIECTVQLDEVPPDANMVGVTVDDTSYDLVDACDAAGSGWLYATPDSIQLCGDACEALRDGGLVEVEYVC
jgi:hypothetical protein